MSEIQSFYPASETVQAGLCLTWLDIPKTSLVAAHIIQETLDLHSTDLDEWYYQPDFSPFQVVESHQQHNQHSE